MFDYKIEFDSLATGAAIDEAPIIPIREHIAPSQVVLVDDEQSVLELEWMALNSAGLAVRTFTDPLAAWEYISRNPVSVVVSDWNMPAMCGMDLLFKTRALPHPPHMIIATAFGTVNRAVQAMNTGAFDFIEKPFEISQFVRLVQEAIKNRCAAADHERPSGSGAPPASLRRLSSASNMPVAASPAMKRVYEIAFAAAAADSTVLLLGESGTGKEVLAEYIHRNSRRCSGALVKVNCGALPEHLMESELFGHEKGSFTGADRQHIGRFEQAQGGSLFLDEVGDLPLPLQVKLLRAIQNRTIERVGSGATIPVNFRLICATHCDLRQAIAAGNFREDLFYRINVVPVQIPALRDRAEDIAPLAMHFFSQMRRDMEHGPHDISPEALAALQRFHWPGNVRQLRNAIEYALVLCRDRKIQVNDLPEEVRAPRLETAADSGAPAIREVDQSSLAAWDTLNPVASGLRGSVMEAEAELIRQTLLKHQWKIAAVARELNVCRSTLYERMKLYGIRRPLN